MFHFTEQTQVIDFVVFFGSFYVYVLLFLKYIHPYPTPKHTLQSQVAERGPFMTFSASAYFRGTKGTDDKKQANTMILLKKTDFQFAEQSRNMRNKILKTLDFLFQVCYSIIVASEKENHNAYA